MSSLSGIEFTLQQLRSALRQESLALIVASGRARPATASASRSKAGSSTSSA